MTLDMWTHMMLRASLQGAIALGVVWVICLLLRQSMPWAQCWLWRLGYGKFALVLVALAPLNVPLLPAAPSARTAAVQSVSDGGAPVDKHASAEDAIASAGTTAMVSETSHPVASPAAVAPGAADTAAPPITPRPPTDTRAPGAWWPAAFFIAWLAGVLFCGMHLARAWRRTTALRHSGTPISNPALQQRFEDLAQRMAVRLPALLVVERDGPLLTGVLRPAILLPHALLQNGSPNHLHLVLAHELAHLKRRDLFWNSLQALIETAFFFHPLLWLARAQTRQAQELACDELALRVTQSSPAAYGRTLLDVLELQQMPSTRLWGAGVAASASTLKRRILAMKDLTPWSRKRALAVGTLVAITGTLALLPWRVVAQSAPSPTAASGPTTAPTAVAAKGTAPSEKIVTQTIPVRFLADMASSLSVDSGAAAALSNLKSFQLIGPKTTVVVDDKASTLTITGTAADIHRLAEIIGAWEFDHARLLRPAPPDMPPEVLVKDGRLDVPILEVQAPVDGTIKEVAARDGQQVKKGTVLFKLDDRAALAAVDMAKLTLQNAELAGGEFLPGTTEKALAQNRAAMAKIQLQAAQDALDDLIIRALQDGVVEEFNNRPGQLVTKGTRLANVVDTADLRVTFSAEPEHAGRVAIGQSFTLAPARGPAVSGEVTAIWPTVTPQGDEVQVWGKVVSGDHLERLFGGMVVTIYLTPAQPPR